MSVSDMTPTVKEFFALKRLKAHEVMDYLSFVRLEKIFSGREGWLVGKCPPIARLLLSINLAYDLTVPTMPW